LGEEIVLGRFYIAMVITGHVVLDDFFTLSCTSGGSGEAILVGDHHRVEVVNADPVLY